MPAPRGLVQQLDQVLHKNDFFPRDVRLLVAVSGGADSVALLRLMAEMNRSDYWNWTLIVGHVDHGMRGKQSAEDARFVRALAKELGLNYVERKLKLGRRVSEQTAREGRHAALKTLAIREKCAGAVLAHHADDQAETILMRMFRGCGVDGLAAMSGQQVFDRRPPEFCIWRPLLGVRRFGLRDYLQGIGQAWREDASNESMDFARNQLRAQVMPLVEAIWPEAVHALCRLSQIAREEHRVIEGEADELWAWRVKNTKAGLEFPCEALHAAMPAVTAEVIRGAIAATGRGDAATFERTLEALRIIYGDEGGKRVEFGGGIGVEVSGKIVRIGRLKAPRRRRTW